MIVVDTGAMLALLDGSEDNHRTMKGVFDNDPEQWVIPAAILPEVDYLVAAHLGARAGEALASDPRACSGPGPR